MPAPETRARILLVDDDERNLLALSEVLEPLADVVTAPSGREALRELLKEEFAVILLDVFMPEMDGYETAKLVRQRPQTARIPIIFLSAVNKETEHLMRGYAMGAVDYVFKPVDPVVLRSKVAVFVDLFLLRQQIADQARAEQELREAKLQADVERLAAERELQHSRLRQAAILEALPLALYEANFDGRGQLVRRFVGGDVTKIVGEDAEALTTGALRWCDRIAGADMATLERRMAESSEASLTSHYRWSRSDGTTLHIIDQCVRSSDREGVWVGTLIDVTAQRQLEQELVQARKSEALGQLTGGVAHDFNNLLAAVLGGLRLLEQRLSLRDREQQILDHMRHAAESGAELVRRLMAFARKQELSPTGVDPQALSSAVAGLVAHALDGVALEWQLPDHGLDLYVDQAQLELALVNLLINARDAMPQGGRVEVAIEEVSRPPQTERPGEPRPFLQVRVRDEGSGIPPELVERVTEPFFTTKAAGKGTGLGLSMVAGFVAQSGGTFRIDSRPGKGTDIVMILPATPAAGRPDEPGSPEEAATIRIGSVLVVDDDEGVREIVSEQLRDLGLKVTVAIDAQHALTLVQRKRKAPEFVLTDFSMPGLDGMDLLAAMRERWPRLKGAIMTGNPQENLSRRLDDVPVVHKPLDLAELKRLLAEA